MVSMTVCCRMVTVPDGEVFIYEVCSGDTYETALLTFGINPDTVLIIYREMSLPQDKPIEEEEVEILLTCSCG